MIIVRITGGLGNQMFQYAVGRQLAETHKTLLKLDLSSFESDYRKYALHCFHIHAFPATSEEIEDVQGIYGSVEKVVLKITRKLGFRNSALRLARKGATVSEKLEFHFDPDVLNAPKDSYLQGYWQSEKYFLDIQGILRQEFQVKYPQSSENRRLSELIQNTNSVAVHIRRGDYAANPALLEKHGLCDILYYQNAIQQMSEKIADVSFYVFSDEPDWAKLNLDLKFPTTFIDHNDETGAYEDMRLMSQCKHQIIANSSFSWWAAWLNNNPDKIVIAPLKWFNNAPAETQDLVPNQWVRL